MSLGLTTGKRKIKTGTHFNRFFPSENSAYGNNIVLNENGDVHQTVDHIARIIKKDSADTAQIAQELKGSTREKTLANVHQFMIDYLQYDTETGEKLRSPRRTWWVGSNQNDRETGDNGVDCDDMVIFSGSILHNLNIPYFIRISKISKNEFQHVYLLIPQSGNQLTGTYVTLDGVLSKYNYEYPYKQQITFDMQGIKIEYLGSLGSVEDNGLLPLLKSQKTYLLSHRVEKINKHDALYLIESIIDNWDDPKSRIIAIEDAAVLEQLHYPNMTYFQKLHEFFLNGRIKKSISLGSVNDPCSMDYYPMYEEDPNWYEDPNWQPPAYCNSNGNSSGNGSNFNWNELLDSLAKFDWGLLYGNRNGNNNTTIPTVPTTTNAGFRIAGMGVGTLASIGLAGALVYMLYTNMQGSKAGVNPFVGPNKKQAA